MSIVVGSFLLKLKTISMDFEIKIFCNILKENVHREVNSQKYQKLLPEQESIADVSFGIFLWRQSYLQKLQETVSGQFTSSLKQRIRTIVNSLKLYYTPSQMFSKECFQKAFLLKQLHQKLRKINSKTFVVEFPLAKITRLQFKSYNRTTNVTTDYFSWSAQKPLQKLSLFL